MMQTAPLDNYGDLVSEGRSGVSETFSAVREDRTRCRLTVFTAELSANDQFRAAWRRDLGLLKLLPHDGLPQIVDSGDEHGIVYIATAAVPEMTLRHYLESNALTWDEIADIGWQISSVMQHLHNSGVAHGGLDDGCVRITPQLRVSVVDTGVSRWILAAGEESASASINLQCRNDLIALGHLMRKLTLPVERHQIRAPSIPDAWWELIEGMSDSDSKQFPATAREVQGRLGRILLEDAGEAMKVVAARTGEGYGRRSILDELLPIPVTDKLDTLPERPPVWKRSWVILVVALAATAVAVALLGGM